MTAVNWTAKLLFSDSARIPEGAHTKPREGNVCEVVRRGSSAVMLSDDGQPLKHVVVFGRLVVAFERDQGVLVGTHAEVSQSRAQQIVGLLNTLVDEWNQAELLAS